jgi:uncharacterized RDD family membrane protein YckC
MLFRSDGRGHLAISRYPNLLRRYLAAVIDGVAIIVLVVLVGQLPFYSGGNEYIGILVFLLVLANYEPILTAFLCTAGQAVMRFRVRDVATQARVPIWRLYIRVVVKALLGMVSFLTLPARADRRAIHDFAAKTLVVEASEPRAARNKRNVRRHMAHRPTEPLDEVARVMALEKEWERRLSADQRSHLKFVTLTGLGAVAIIAAALLWIMSR